MTEQHTPYFTVYYTRNSGTRERTARVDLFAKYHSVKASLVNRCQAHNEDKLKIGTRHIQVIGQNARTFTQKNQVGKGPSSPVIFDRHADSFFW